MLGIGLSVVMTLGKEVVDGPAVRYHYTLVTPLVAQDLLQQAAASAAGLILVAVVGAHNLLDIGLLYKCLEGGQIGLSEVTCCDILGVVHVTVPLRTAVHRKVLGAGVQLVVLGIGRTLKTVYNRYTHPGCQVRVLAVGLLTASPARVAEYVYVRGPERETLVAAQTAVLTEFG